DFSAALQLDPDPLVRYVALNHRGVLNIRRQRWEEAVQDLLAAVQVQPQRFEGHVNLAHAYQGLKKWPEAVAALREAIKRAPHLPAVYENRAKLHLLREDWKAARADFEQAIAREPAGKESDRLVDNLLELGQLLHDQGEYAAALACFDRALKL